MLRHLRRGEVESHPNKLHLFCPWSREQPSTAPDMADGVHYQLGINEYYKTGTNARPGSMFLVALQDPWLFGIAEVLYSDDITGNISYRWYGSRGTAPSGVFEKGWIGPKKTVYFASEPRDPTHKPYLDVSLIINQTDVECHSFQLTPGHRLPEHIKGFIEECPFIDFPKGSRREPDCLQQSRENVKDPNLRNFDLI